MKKIGVVTVGRSDYGIYYSLLKAVEADPDCDLHLIVAGMHLDSRYGSTINEIREEGFVIGDIVEMPLREDSPEGISRAIGRGVEGFAASFAEKRPDILVVLGDRYEMHAAALAALPFKIPLVHIHGGELTRGAIDDSLRHGITKMAHLHFVTTPEYKRRVEQMGEEPKRVIVTGAPALDNIDRSSFLSRQALAAKFDLRLERAPILVTYHPVTLEYEETEKQVDNLLEALDRFSEPIVFTATNADTRNSVIRKKIYRFLSKNKRARMVSNFGPKYYFNMMAESLMMVGNTSSGLIEAASFALPVVNIGRRQEGRVRGENVIDVGYETKEIIRGMNMAASAAFRESIRNMKNPYDRGGAVSKMLAHLKELVANDSVLLKKFEDRICS